jgi:hypothetical protein
MRIKSLDDISKLGTHAKAQVESILKSQGGFNNLKRPDGEDDFKKRPIANSSDVHKAAKSETTGTKKKAAPSRVMKTGDGTSYCPWPSTDPFVQVHQQLEARYGRYEDGGSLVTEMIVSGGEKNWRFDFAILPQLNAMAHTSDFPNINNSEAYSGRFALLLEADGFQFHRSLTAFKNDRAKQTHALKEGFLVKRITNEDVRQRLDEVMADIDTILCHQRVYLQNYRVISKGHTQSVFHWETHQNE